MGDLTVRQRGQRPRLAAQRRHAHQRPAVVRRVNDRAVVGPPRPARFGGVGEDHDGAAFCGHFLQFPASDEGDPPSVRGEAGGIRPLRAVEKRGAELVEMPNVQIGRASGWTGDKGQHGAVRRQRDRRVGCRQRAFRPELDAHPLGRVGRSGQGSARRSTIADTTPRRAASPHGTAARQTPRRGASCVIDAPCGRSWGEASPAPRGRAAGPSSPGSAARDLRSALSTMRCSSGGTAASARVSGACSPCSTAACTSALVTPTKGRRPATIS